MIVSFSGAQGTGKSQTLEAVAKLLPEKQGWRVKPSCSSRSLKQFYEAESIDSSIPWWQLDCEQQGRIQLLTMLNALSDLLEVQSSEGNWILDRSIFDVMAYSRLKAKQCALSPGVLSVLEATYDRVIRNIDLIVLFTPDPAYAIEASEFRCQTNQSEAAAEFDKLYKEHPMYKINISRFLSVPRGSISAKAEAIVAVLQTLLQCGYGYIGEES